jgi:hypothetical protein
MSKNTRWTPHDLKRLNLVEKDGQYVKVSSLVSKKVKKLLPLITDFQQSDIVRIENRETGNKKVRNATKSVVNGVKFDSNLEKYMHYLLTGAQIDFEFQKVFILQPKFKYHTENVRAISKIVDFYLESRSVIIDTKGFSNDVSPMKHKMLKFALMNDYGIQPEIFMPSTKQECQLLLNRLLYDK